MALITTLVSAVEGRGRQRVVFSHFDDVAGVTFGPFVEFRPDGEDQAAFFLACRQALLASLIAADIADNLSRIKDSGSLAVVALRYATIGDVRTALRAAYQNAIRTEAIMIGDFLSGLTTAQLQSLFGMTAGQVTTLRANKLTTAAAAASTIRASAGQ